MDEFGSTLGRSLRMTLFLAVPSSVGLGVLGGSMIGAVYQWGRFQAFDTRQTAAALGCYSVGLAGYSAVKLLAPAFYALEDARTPMLVSVGSIAVNAVCALLLARRWGMGHAGLALSTSIVALAASAALFVLLRARLAGMGAAMDGRRLGVSALRICAAASATAVACVASSHAVHALAGAGKAAQLADVAVSIPLGAAVFCAAAHWLGCEELKELRAACYTAVRNAPRPEVGDPLAGNRSSSGGTGA
jgi:putative peptidoglycan lipid II flippase